MGITIRSKNVRFDISYITFNVLRGQVVESWLGCSEEIGKAYCLMGLIEKNKKMFYDALVEHKKIASYDDTYFYGIKDKETEHIFNFLFRSDCEGKIGLREAKVLKPIVQKINGANGRLSWGKNNVRDLFMGVIDDALQNHTPIIYN